MAVNSIELELEVDTIAPQRPTLLIWSVSNVTAALSAIKEPLLEHPIVTVIVVRAIIFPVKRVTVPIVTKLPIC